MAGILISAPPRQDPRGRSRSHFIPARALIGPSSLAHSPHRYMARNVGRALRQKKTAMRVRDTTGGGGGAAVDIRQPWAPSGSRLALPSIADIENYCVFLDLDRTLVEIEDRPDDVRVDDSTRQFIERLRDRVGRALALVSGRDIHVVDRLLHPLTLPVAGVHGLQRRDAAGRLHTPIIDWRVVESIATQVEAAFSAEPGVGVEKKTGAVAIHFRLRPDFEKRCCALARQIVRDRPDLHLVKGKMVCEIRLNGHDTGAVIAAFLNERPFKGRKPIFASDDAADEAGFAAVNARGGVSIKIGQDPTVAKFRAANVVELRGWFDELLMPARMVGIQ
jgi:trehalose 6-phosphate phosphatase